MRTASDAAEAVALLRDAPAGRVALVDASFVGHPHALRLGLTDPRFPAGAVPGAVTVQDPSRAALVRALESEAAAPAPGGD
ncbi:CDP-alcohol phosphatidyltransferase family protein, partial [Streptomyces sp. SID7982]|nr:CDP-alcohol phosphatidyltransferase family protein [Streptomyces sp. SID7982]